MNGVVSWSHACLAVKLKLRYNTHIHYSTIVTVGVFFFSYQETIPEHEQLKHSMEYDDRPEVGQNAQSLLLVQDSESEVTSAIFRGTDTLVVAHKDGSVSC